MAIGQTEINSILERMNFKTDDITEGTKLGSGGLDVDSLAMMELALVLEEDHGISLEQEQINLLKSYTMGDLLTLLRQEEAQ